MDENILITLEAEIISLSSDVWHFALFIPKRKVELLLTGDKRIVCEFENGLKTYSALLSNGKGDFFININKEVRKKLGVNAGSKVKIKITKDQSEYGMPMPEELGEILYQDVEFHHVFHQLTPGKQRNLIYIVAKPKGSDTRLRKALAICDYLKMVNGKLDFRELNEFFKNNKY